MSFINFSPLFKLFIDLVFTPIYKKTNTMRKNTILLFSLLTTVSVTAQEVVSSQGETYSNSNGSIDFTVGEVIINTGSNGTNDITQGFHQTNWNFLGVEDFAPDFAVTIFPNPTSDVLYIKSSFYQDISYSLFDTQGKLVFKNILSETVTQIQLNQLAPGAYSLSIHTKKEQLKNFKFIKPY
jgi:hypothetical protein